MLQARGAKARSLAFVSVWSALGGALACGGAPAAQHAETKPAPPAEAPAEPSATPEVAPSEIPATEAPAPEAPPAAPNAADPNEQREVKYVVTPEALKIEVAGVRFFASAKSKQVGQGWGATVTVRAEVTDGKPHVLLKPKSGPIAFAAAVYKSDRADAERIADERQGDGEETLLPDGAATFSRDFPARGGRVLAIGETLDLEVGLWGLGENRERQRPVKRFFHVKMKVGHGKPRAVVEPPPVTR